MQVHAYKKVPSPKNPYTLRNVKLSCMLISVLDRIIYGMVAAQIVWLMTHDDLRRVT